MDRGAYGVELSMIDRVEHLSQFAGSSQRTSSSNTLHHFGTIRHTQRPTQELEAGKIMPGGSTADELRFVASIVGSDVILNYTCDAFAFARVPLFTST